MTKSINLDKLQLGVCYYPEHWPEYLWEDDFKRMVALNISIIRVGEFAWSIFEPEEGVFSFEFFDKVLERAHIYGLQVIMGTPTATPPAWLTYKYPEVLNVSKEGVAYQHGMRRHYNYSSPKYQELCARITKKMAEHYKDHPAIIGWQIDNELNCETNVFYSDADHAAFRQWLKNKYTSLEDGELDIWHGPLHTRSVQAWFKQLQYNHIPVDFLYLQEGTTLEDLDHYKTLVYPHPAIMTEKTGELLKQYVEQSGKLVFGARTGYKNVHGHCNMSHFPGPVGDLCGITVEDFTLLNGNAKPALVKWSECEQSEGCMLKAEMFNDILQITDNSVEILAKYDSNYYAGKPVLTKRVTGKGEVYYYGAAFNEPVVNKLIQVLNLKTPVESICELPEQVEVGIRASEYTNYIFS